MLILTRRRNESILIGNDQEIKLTILGIRGNQVQIGIEAPRDIAVHREEVFNRIQESKSEEISAE